jgi:hypothetical protein
MLLELDIELPTYGTYFKTELIDNQLMYIEKKKTDGIKYLTIKPTSPLARKFLMGFYNDRIVELDRKTRARGRRGKSHKENPAKGSSA